MTKKLPHFELAGLKKYDLDIFDEDLKNEHSLFFVLCAAFNDLKNMFWMMQVLEDSRPHDDNVTPYNGQWSGMSIYVNKTIISIFFEFITTVGNNLNGFENGLLVQVIKSCDAETKNRWKQVIRLAKKHRPQRTDSDMYKTLFEIRNEISFHYNNKHLWQGYQSFKNSNSKDELKNIYASFGKNMEKSRFYFTDAFTQAHLNKILTKRNIEITTIFKHIELMNYSCRVIIEKYIKHIETKQKNKKRLKSM